MQTSFGACSNESAIEKVGIEPLQELIKSVSLQFEPEGKAVVEGLGLPYTKGELANLHKTIELLEQIGVGSFEQLGIGADDKNPVSGTFSESNAHQAYTRF